MIKSNTSTSRIFLTGATGFIGHYLLAELLRQGHACTAMVRPPANQSLAKLQSLLQTLGLDPANLINTGRLTIIEAALPDALPDHLPHPIDRIIHAAGSTRFDLNAAGDPARTNEAGTRKLLEFADQHHISEFHLISTAFVCGATNRTATEQFPQHPPKFHNVYEHSKWHAELLAREWAGQPGRTLTVYRPSIVVGDFHSGHTTSFSGPYLLFRACEVLSQMVGDDPDKRHNLKLRIKGAAEDPVNIVPVDYIATVIAGIVAHPQFHQQTYHLVHPRPLSNAALRDAIDQWFDLDGSSFVDPETFAATEPNDLERNFNSIIEPLRPYIIDAPRFGRTNITQIEHSLEINCPAYEKAAVHRLIRYAQHTRWGRKRPARTRLDHACAVYFERFLPSRIPHSQVARVAALTTTARFVIDDIPDGHWVCRFENGQLIQIHRGQNGIAEDFTYHLDEIAFWEIVTGAIDPQTIFLDGRAEITGNIEQALKMGNILRAFNQEHPCDRKTLAASHGRAKHA